MEVIMRGKRKPSVSVYARISLEADQIRSKLEEKFGLTCSALIERAMFVMARELDSEPAQ
jgi:hypothetical protein